MSTSEMSRRSFVAVAAATAGAATLATAASEPAIAAPTVYPDTTTESDFADSAAIAEPITEFVDEKTYDIVVVGAGTAGMPAALTALEEGATVAVLQKETTAISQGGSSSGIILEESSEVGLGQFRREYRRTCNYRINNELLDTYIQHSGETMLWMFERTTAAGFPPYAHVINTFEYEDEGSLCARITNRFGPKPMNNSNMIVALADYAEAQGVEMFYSTPGVQLIQDESGAVTGVVGQNEDGTFTKFNANMAVILATGDYQNNASMVAKYSPDLVGFDRKQVNKTGDGILMSIMAGGHICPPNHSRQMHDIDSGPMTGEPFLMVDESGNRFMNEEIGMDNWNSELRWHEHPGRISQIFDSNYVDQVTGWGGAATSPEDIENYIPGLLEEPTNVIPALTDTHRCDTLEELAEELGIPADALVASVERYNELVAQGADVDFGKSAKYLKPIDTPPFYGIHKHIRITAICGGIAVDGNYQVVDATNSPIPGLYAVGFSAGDLCGGIDWSTYVTGMSNGSCMTSGRVAALHAVKGIVEPTNPVLWENHADDYGAGSALTGIIS